MFTGSNVVKCQFIGLFVQLKYCIDVDVAVERKQAQAIILFARLNNTTTMPALMKIWL